MIDDVIEEVDKDTFNVTIEKLNLPKAITLADDKTLGEVHQVLKENKFGAILLTNGEHLSGIITERDFLIKVWGKIENWKEVPARDLMTSNPFSVRLESTISECISIISKKLFRHIPVVDDFSKPIHMISIKDILGYIIKFFPRNVSSYGDLIDWEFLQVNDYGENFSFFSDNKSKFSGNIFRTPLKRIIYGRTLSVDINKSISFLINDMQEKKVGSALITEYDTELKGIITERDVLFKLMDISERESEDLKITDVMTANPHSLLYKHYMAYAINNMFKYKYRNIIVMDEDRIPIGIVGLLDIFRYISEYVKIDEQKDS